MNVGLTEIFTGIIAIATIITVVRGIPTRGDIADIKVAIANLVDRFDRHLEYHAHTKSEPES